MRAVAALEDTTEKAPVSPGPIVPARELLGDMLLLQNQPREALVAYAASEQVEPNRFRGLYGAICGDWFGVDPAAVLPGRGIGKPVILK